MSSPWLQIFHRLITTYVYKKSTIFFISKLYQLFNLPQQLYKYYKLKNLQEEIGALHLRITKQI